MEKKEVTISKPVTVADVTLIPVVEVALSSWWGTRGISFTGVKRPLAAIVISHSFKKAFRMTGEEISIDQLIREVPQIKQELDIL